MQLCPNGTDGVISLKNGGVSNGTGGVTYDASSGNGKIVIEDIADFVAIAAGKEYKFASGSKVTTEVNNTAEYNSALTVTDLTDITLNGGTWKIAESAVDDKVIAMPTRSISTKGDVTLMFDGESAFTNELDLTVESGSVALKSVDNIGTSDETEVNSTATIGISSLTIKKGASMSVPASITVNKAETGNTAEAVIGGTLTVDGKMYFNKTQVGDDDNTEAELKLNPHATGENPAIFGVQTGAEFKNYGTVSASVTTEKPVRGKVSQATSVGNGTLVGEWAGSGDISWT